MITSSGNNLWVLVIMLQISSAIVIINITYLQLHVHVLTIQYYNNTTTVVLYVIILKSVFISFLSANVPGVLLIGFVKQELY